MKLLPAQRQAHHPDDQGAQAVQHHTGGGADLLSDADAGEVEERDADGVSQQSQQDERPVPDLTEGVQSVLQDVPRVVAEVAHIDEIHGDEQQRQDAETEQTWRQKTEFNGSSPQPVVTFVPRLLSYSKVLERFHQSCLICREVWPI